VDEALAAFAVARAVSPTPARVLTGEAILLSELGRKSEALATLDQAIALEPRLAEAWYTRANLIRYPADHPDLGAMAALADDPLTPASGRMQLQFALGKAMLDLDQGEEAFRRLGEGARLKRATIEYSPASDARRAELIVSFYTQALLARAPRDETAGERAIFVIGMPRSGTTLIEQILASHPDVHGAGETTYLAAIAEGRDFLDALAQSEPTALADLGRTYLEQLGRGVSPGLRLVDKMPTNFLHAGAIPLILPGARIIHCRRDPLDTCLSCYSLLFTRGQEYSYELGELGHYYRLYRELMAHWRTVLPPQSLLEVDYEALVREPEGEIRRLVEFCALSWDEACLRFYETPRRVTSASLSQVRSPLYASSIGRAQRFRPWLGPLEAAIGASG
jgi:tetratricopeptide (TPR) repeat protein